jgi:hypothetical protein
MTTTRWRPSHSSVSQRALRRAPLFRLSDSSLGGDWRRWQQQMWWRWWCVRRAGVMYNYRRANLGKNDFRCSFNLSFSNNYSLSLSHTLSNSLTLSPSLSLSPSHTIYIYLSLAHAYSRVLSRNGQDLTSRPPTTYLVSTPPSTQTIGFLGRFFTIVSYICASRFYTLSR